MKQITYLIIALCLLAPPSALAGRLVPDEAQAPAREAAAMRPAPGQSVTDAATRQPADVAAPPQPVDNDARRTPESAKAWVRLESGAKPAYVGIQGGTAPSSLLRATDGSLFFFTGNTGNDFTRVLGGSGKHNGTRLAAGDDRALSAEKEELQPFGLSNPEGVTPEEEPHEADLAEEAAAFTPLRLKSYKDLLSYSGSL